MSIKVPLINNLNDRRLGYFFIMEQIVFPGVKGVGEKNGGY